MPKLDPFGQAISGAGGAVLALCLTYPLDIVKTRLQVQTKDSAFSTDYKSTSDAIQQIIHRDGLAGLYAGLPSALVGTASSSFSYFYAYTIIRGGYMQMLKARSSSARDARLVQIGTAMELLLGALAGAASQLFTIPVSVVTTRQQTTTPGKGTAAKSMLETARQIVEEEGVTGLWKGLRPALVLTSNPALTYGVFERVKSSIVRSRQVRGVQNPALTSLETFLLGVLCKAIATVVTYPYIIAKVRLQWKPSDYQTNERVHYKSAVDVLIRTVQSEGWRGLYKGMQAQLSKAVLTQALLFVLKDKIAHYTYYLLYAQPQAKPVKATA